MEYTIAQVYHVDLVSPVTGLPVQSFIVGYLQIDEVNEKTNNIVTANFTTNSTYYDRVETFATSAAFVAWELITLMTGTYIFWILGLWGVPQWMIVMFVTLYAFLLARTIIGLVRGV